MRSLHQVTKELRFMNIEKTIVAVCCSTAVVTGCASLSEDAATLDEADLRFTAAAEVTDAGANDVTIRSIDAQEGCGATARIAGDGRTAELRFSGFEANVDASVSEASVQCPITIGLAVPPGASFALEELSVEGTMALAEGMTAHVEAIAHPVDAPAVAARGRYFRGPGQGPVAFFADFVEDDLAFSRCTDASALVIELKLTVKNGAPAAAGRIAVTRFRPLRVGLRACLPGGEKGVPG